jgi:tRNA A37 threonylcarbamoyltransferase TsaD
MNQFAQTQIEDAFEASQNRLVIQSSDFSLSGLKDMVDSQVIDLSPQYQRRERWDVQRQSQLIESFLLNVPVPERTPD